MRKIIIWFMIIIMSLFPVFRRKPIIAHAATIEDNTVSAAPLPTNSHNTVTVPAGDTVTGDGAICAMANVLTWEMLQTYLYALTGQQAYDVYANNDENSQALYEDFGTWLQTQKQGAQISYQLTKANSIIAYTTLSNAINYYKTAGSSALQEMQEEAKTQLQVINGGLSNNTSPAPSPTSGSNVSEFVTNMKSMEIIGNSALTYYIGKYISELVSGNRGEVSKTFLNTADISELYYDGNYSIDASGNLYFNISGKGYIYVSGSGYSFFDGGEYLKWKEIFTESENRFALFLDKTSTGEHYNFSESEPLCYPIRFYYIDNSGSTCSYKNVSGKVYLGYESDNITINVGTFGLYLAEETCCNISDIPCFDNETDLQKYLLNGDYSGALNAFVGVQKPSNWLGYDFSALSNKLDQVLGALTTLPTITTDDLAGFAQGVGNAIVAGNVPASDPATQQQQMQQLLEEQARNTATKCLTDSATNNKELDEWTDENPRPTKTPDELVHDENVKDGTMVVDLHEFFPFCVPFDMVRLIKVLQAEPKAPCFEGAIKYDKLNINVPIKIDLSGFNDVAKVFRLCETILFILGLILITRNLIRG